jgi:hypothetical protein
MRLSNVIITFFVMVVFASSCIEPFTPGTSDYDEMLLIEGLITDNPMVPARVTISKTISLDRNYLGNYWFGSGAMVLVVCDDGNVYPFTETYAGNYVDIANALEPEAGKLYKLTVQTNTGEIFESDFESYKPSPPIDSITFTPEEKKISELDVREEGLQFYANSKSIDGEPVYLRWMLDATYTYSVPLYSEYIWNGETLEEYHNDEFRVCWKNENIGGIFIGNSYGMAQNRVADAPLNFVSQFGDQLMIKYSLHAFQLSISESSYRFWYDLNQMINETGGLYETQPFRLEGNIRCTSDPDVNVIGVFEVAGVSELRVFAPRPTEFRVYSTYHCHNDTIGGELLPWSKVRPGSYVFEPDEGLFITSADFCFICTLNGGTIVRPPFWE